MRGGAGPVLPRLPPWAGSPCSARGRARRDPGSPPLRVGGGGSGQPHSPSSEGLSLGHRDGPGARQGWVQHGGPAHEPLPGLCSPGGPGTRLNDTHGRGDPLEEQHKSLLYVRTKPMRYVHVFTRRNE